MKYEANYTLDFRETIVPFAMLVMIQALRDMSHGEVLEILVRDPAVRSDVFRIIPGWCCELVHVDFDKETNLFLIQLKKTDARRP